MASLWNFVARLASKWRRVPQESLPPPDVVDHQDAARRPVTEAPADQVLPATEPTQAAAIGAEPDRAVATVVPGPISRVPQAMEAVAPAVAGDDNVFAPGDDIQVSLPIARLLVPRRQKKTTGKAVAVSLLAPVAAVTPQANGLDDEIRLLRRALIGKLELQNAQLKAMLERFER